MVYVSSANIKPCLKTSSRVCSDLQANTSFLCRSPLRSSHAAWQGEADPNRDAVAAAAFTRSHTCHCRDTAKDGVAVPCCEICRSLPVLFMLHCLSQTLRSLEHHLFPRGLCPGEVSIALCFGPHSPEVCSCNKGHAASHRRSLSSLSSEEAMPRGRGIQHPFASGALPLV